MLWIPVVLSLLTAALALGLFFFFCLRRPVPDPLDDAALQRYGNTIYGRLARREKAWFEARTWASVSTRSDDELALRGLLLTQKGAKGTVLLLHGYRSHWKEDFVIPGLARFFYDQGYQLLIPDQRAHGASEGRYITLGLWERFDARTWCEYLAFRFGERHPLYLYGHSMGGTAALLAASLDLPGNVRGILADGAYTSPAELLRLTLVKSWLPVDPTMALLNAAASVVGGFRMDDGSTLRTLRDTAYPLMAIHGTKDQAVPVRMARQNFEVAAGKMTLLLVEGAGHGQCWLAEPERLRKAVGEFLATHLREF